MKIKLENIDDDEDDEVLVTCNGAGAADWAKKEQQSISGTHWEADGPDFAYAMITNQPDLLKKLAEEGYDDIDDSEYCPFEPARVPA